ncbi:MAG: hypothetical protein SVK54_02605 [candidate division WOR-3 bacterium]|nr:hypothetical protein [candidate division WOR-3 bacterium]
MRHAILLITAIILMTGCGKKEMPPSPDIFAPKFVSASYTTNSRVMLRFNESIDRSIDSVFLGDTALWRAEDYVIENNVLYVYYKKTPSIFRIYGIEDRAGNSIDEAGEIPGNPLIDSIPPSIVRTTLNDSLILLTMSEPVRDYSIDILPRYLSYETEAMSEKIYVHYKDTMGTYPIVMIIDSVSDYSGNTAAVRERRQFGGDSLIEYKETGIPLSIEFVNVYSADSMLIDRLENKNSIIKTKMLPGIYYLKLDSILKQITVTEE